MAVDRTKPNVDWLISDENGDVPTWECVSIAVLMDIRRELRRLNAAIYCSNFIAIPHTLTAIRRNTAKRTPRKKATR